MASIEARGTNSWRLTVEAGYDSNGKRLREKKTIRIDEKLSPKKMDERLNEELVKFKMEVESGQYIAPEKMTFGAFIDEWREKFAKGKKYAPKTTELNEYMFTLLLPHLGNKKMSDIKTMHIVQYFSDIEDPQKRLFSYKGELSSSTLISLHRILRNIFGVAVTWKVIKDSPMEGLKYPKKIKVKAECYDEDESKELLEILETQPLVWKAIVTLAITTGMRRGEICGLEWRHINLDKGIIEIEQQMVYTKETQKAITPPKTADANRKVSIPRVVVDLLKTLRKQTVVNIDKMGSEWKGSFERQFVFTTSSGSPFGPEYVSSKWHNFVRKHGLRPIKFHALRHTSASLLINQGVHSKVISERLGHSDIAITMNVYGHVFRKADHDAANKFDDMFSTKNKEIK
ncbi:hypothetical protein BK124_00515 [Paenibacillus amylolyticus]|uniref:site-specific integrase n=1 Tax=Paenibacillus amylolyticus TaxID=1451 RepID=UPI00096C8A9C|nr:site-specific integrase [Paenibacillus amylolyticus]OMF01195.1 hypothetical protein BK124_00515 [Paenibacillus amylolyticus]